MTPQSLALAGIITPESDIYSFGMVILQVFKLDCGYGQSFLQYRSGPYRRDAIPRHSDTTVGAPCTQWDAPEETRERQSDRIF